MSYGSTFDGSGLRNLEGGRQHLPKAKHSAVAAAVALVTVMVVAVLSVSIVSNKGFETIQTPFTQHEGVHDSADSISKLDASVQTKSRPHIVFMLVDDMGYNDVGYMSSDLKSITPIIDSLAESGIILQKYYSMHMCTPARAALLTAKYPSNIGMQFETIKPDSPWGLPLSETTMPEFFKERGYETHAIGKWNQGHYSHEYIPTSRGFNTFYGYLTDEIHYYTHKYPEEFCFDITADFSGSDSVTCTSYYDFIDMDASSGYTPATDDSNTYSSLMFAQRAVEKIKVTNSSEKSLFLYFAAQNVHGPLDSPPKQELEHSQLEVIKGINNPYRKKFGGLLAILDKTVDLMMTALKSSSLYENTIFVMASDNGGCHEQGGSNYPLRGGKHFLFEGGVRVPALIHSYLFDESIRGMKYQGLFHVTDWLPTLMSAASISYNADEFDGVDHLPHLLGEVSKPPRGEVLLSLNSYTVCCQDFDFNETCHGFLSECANVYMSSLTRLEASRAALISGKWKLITNEYGLPWYGTPGEPVTEEGEALVHADDDDTKMGNCNADPGTGLDQYLFNLEEDPRETTNLYRTELDVVNQMTAKLKTYQEKEVRSVWTPQVTYPYSTWNLAGKFIVPWMDGR